MPAALDYHTRERRLPVQFASWVVIFNAYLLPLLIWFVAYSALLLLFRVNTGKWELQIIHNLGPPWPERFQQWIQSIVPWTVFLIPILNFAVAAFVRGKSEIWSVAMWLAGFAIFLSGILFNLIAVVCLEQACWP